MQLEGERIRLRTFREADAAAFVAYRSIPEIARFQGWECPYPLERALSYIYELEHDPPGVAGDWYQLAIEERASGTLLGDIGFCVRVEDPTQAEIGFTLDRPYHGRGYAQEAVTLLLDFLFLEQGLHRVTANCLAGNLPSAHLLERIGMRREAHFVASAWFEGGYSDEYWYAILASEWKGMRLRQNTVA